MVKALSVNEKERENTRIVLSVRGWRGLRRFSDLCSGKLLF
jgi:hypothetical protein